VSAANDSWGKKLGTIIEARPGRFIRRVAGSVFALSAIVSLAVAPGASTAADLDSALAIETQGNDESAKSQQRIDQIDDQTDSMAAEYRTTLDQIDSLRVYNAQLAKLLSSQEAELASLDEQIGNVTVIGREITPMMLRMVDALDAFLKLDVPLLMGERLDRVEQIRTLMNRADVEDAEKYRRIMEAYQIENEYGRTIEAYQDTLDMGGQERTLDILRIGRIALLYQTLDGKEVGAWDQAQRQWVELPGEFRDSIRKGVRIARKQMAPDLIRVPVAAAVAGGR
jgi:hypothetical protein